MSIKTKRSDADSLTYAQRLYRDIDTYTMLWLGAPGIHHDFQRRLREYHQLMCKHGAQAFVTIPYMVAKQFLEDLRKLCSPND